MLLLREFLYSNIKVYHDKKYISGSHNEYEESWEINILNSIIDKKQLN